MGTTANDLDAMTGTPDAATLARRYRDVRARTEALCDGLSSEDCVVQSMPDASPAKWHLGHTTWFFETFVLAAAVSDHVAFDPSFAVLFNSYYNAVGEQHPRPRRGMLTRPPLDRVRDYRRRTDDLVLGLLEGERLAEPDRAIVELGLHHEQQHQELLLMDLKHLFWCNPLAPAYRETGPAGGRATRLEWVRFDAGVHRIGHGGDGFSFDNERPRHRAFVEAFELASRVVTCGEWLEFLEDGGYERPELWLADGWAVAREAAWRAPAYWRRSDDGWTVFTLGGPREVHPDEPVCHVSHYEADAFARWAGARLPTEFEWETAAAELPVRGNLAADGALHPLVPRPGDGLRQMFGDVWEWTASAYLPYPGYRPAAGALGEYNGKFMANQIVLRGGSFATPSGHLRPTYRNFYYPRQRWMFSGVRLARDV